LFGNLIRLLIKGISCMPLDPAPNDLMLWNLI